MSDVAIVLKLPEALVNEAKAAGLLTSERVAALLTAELERQHAIAALREDVRKLRALQPEITPEEIDEEIRAARTQSDKN